MSEKKKILIVEDEPMLREMYRDKIQAAGYEAVTAEREEEALDLMRRERPDLVLLDILLAEGNGTTFLANKNQIPEVASIPVLAFSNFDDPETREKAQALGVLDYLLKTNYTPQQIIDKIREYLGEA